MKESITEKKAQEQSSIDPKKCKLISINAETCGLVDKCPQQKAHSTLHFPIHSHCSRDLAFFCQTTNTAPRRKKKTRGSYSSWFFRPFPCSFQNLFLHQGPPSFASTSFKDLTSTSNRSSLNHSKCSWTNASSWIGFLFSYSCRIRSDIENNGGVTVNTLSWSLVASIRVWKRHNLIPAYSFAT